jgi:hypothetical protein
MEGADLKYIRVLIPKRPGGFVTERDEKGGGEFSVAGRRWGGEGRWIILVIKWSASSSPVARQSVLLGTYRSAIPLALFVCNRVFSWDANCDVLTA